MSKKLPHKSKHKVKGKIVEVPRRWDPAHIDAGYHEQVMGEHSHEEHDLLGVYKTTVGRLVITHAEGEPVYGLRCECGAYGPAEEHADHVEAYHTGKEPHHPDNAQDLAEPPKVLIGGSITVGPEFNLRWDNGMGITTPCADNVREYLDIYQAELVED